MSDSIGDLYVRIKADADALNREIASLKGKLNKDAESMGNGFASKFGKGLALIGGAVGFGVISATMRNSVQAAIQAEQAFAKVSTAIKTTGGAAGFTASELSSVAKELSKITGIDDDQIMNDVTAQLLTFTNVSGTAFKRAQIAAMDLSAVIGNDLKGQTIQLGKALEDPEEGMTALRRAGVTFTDQQEDMVKKLMASNDLLGAQNLILTEIEAKYGGQAAALNKVNGGLNNLSVAFGNFMEKVGGYLLNYLSPFVSGLTDLFDESENLADSFLNQTSALQKTEKEVDGLISTYDNLKGKPTLTKDEHVKLNETIEALTTIVPGAVTAWDEYGRAIDLNRDKIKDWIEAEKVRLQYLNSDAISKASNDIEVYNRKMSNAQNSVLKGGYFRVTIDNMGMENSTFVEYTQDEIKQLNKDIQSYGDSIKGAQEQLKKLKGEALSVPEKTVPSKSNSGNISKVKDQTKALEEQLRVYDALYYGQQKWYDLNVAAVKEQTKELITNGVAVADAQAFEKKQIDELTTSYSNLKSMVNELKTSKLEAFNPQISFDGMQGLPEGDLNDGVHYQKSKLEHYADILNEGTIFDGENRFVASVETAMDTAGSFVDGFFDQMRVSSDGANSMLEQGFVSMANAFLSQVQRMAAEWVAFQALRGIFGLLGLPIAGAVSSATTIIKDIPGSGLNGFHNGGEFTVPSGFPNDSYPIMVESGERVKVTPSNQVGNQERLLATVASKLDILNLNLLEQGLNSPKSQSLLVNGQINGTDIYLSNKRQSKIERRYQ